MDSKIKPKSRPKKTKGEMTKHEIGCGSLYIFCGVDEDGYPVDVFANIGKYGGCSSQSESTARLASLALRSGVDPDEIISELKGIKCPSASREKVKSCPHVVGIRIEEVINEWRKTHGETEKEPEEKQEEVKEKSVKTEVIEKQPVVKTEVNTDIKPIHRMATLSGNTMENIGSINRDLRIKKEQEKIDKGMCPDCGDKLMHLEGCLTCNACGWSKCS